MKISDILLTIGLIVLLAGAVMTFFEPTKYIANYVLIGGAIIIFIRGPFRTRDK